MANAAITWVGAADRAKAEVRMYDRLVLETQPDARGKEFIEGPAHSSPKVVAAIVKPSLGHANRDNKFQFESHGYLVADRVDHEVGKPVFILAIRLKDSREK